MKFLLGACLVLFSQYCFSQSLAVNNDGSTASSSAILDVKSDSKGLLLPRMTKTQKNAIATPATGLLVFQTGPDSTGFHYYNGSQWLWLDPFVSNTWKIKGNTGTDTAVNFLGTTDNMPLRFKQNNIRLAQWDLNAGNYFIGDGAGVLKQPQMQNSIAIGDSALAFSGDLLSTSTSDYTVAIGYKALKSHKAQIGNVAVGAFTLQNFSDNNAGGGGFGSIAIGYTALNKLKTGQVNVGIGVSALFSDTIGTNNTAIGYQALALKKNGNNNVGFGGNAGINLRIGNDNTFIGTNTFSALDSLVNATAIGSKAQVDTSNAMVLGSISGVNTATQNVNVAIGTTKPKAPLHVSRGSSGTTLIIPSNRISLFEDNASHYIQLMSPNANETGILAGNAETLVKSGIIFTNDSSILLRTGGNNTRLIIVDTGNVGINDNFPSSKLTLNGSFAVPVRVITSAANTTLTSDDHTLIINNPVVAAFTINLPLVTTVQEREYVIVNQNSFTHSTNFGYRDFSNAAVTTIPANSSITLQGSGSFWYRVR